MPAPQAGDAGSNPARGLDGTSPPADTASDVTVRHRSIRARAVAAGGRLCRPGGQPRLCHALARRRGRVGEPGVAPPPSSRARLATRPGCLPGEAGSIPVESASRRSSMDERHAPTVEARGFDSSRRDCVARLVSEPSGRDPVEQGAIPWRRLWPSPAVAAPKATPSGACPARRAGIRALRGQTSTTGRSARRRSDMAVERGSIPRSSTRWTTGRGGAWPPRRFREPESAGSTPAGQIAR